MELAAIGFELNAESQPFFTVRPVAAVLESEPHQMRRDRVPRLARQDRAANRSTVQRFSLAEQGSRPFDLVLQAHLESRVTDLGGRNCTRCNLATVCSGSR